MATIVDNQILDRVKEVDFRSTPDARRLMLRRAEFLDRRDQTLVQLVLRGTLSLRDIAGLVGSDAGTVCRRMARLANRLNDPLVVALTDPRCPLPAEHRQLGIEHFVRGIRFRDLVELHRMSPHAVRRMLTFIRGWHKGVVQGRVGGMMNEE
jgi:hypothetical protein